MMGRGMTGATGNIYCGLHDFSEMAFVLHTLRHNDLFVDIGANVGSYTILAAGVVGTKGICFEPVPSTFEHLSDNLYLNRLVSRVIPHNCALGDSAGEIRFTADSDTKNHVVTEPEHETQRTILVQISRLDEVVLELTQPTIWKIDVEGFEQQVILGAGALLASPNLWAVIMEYNGNDKRYGNSEATLHEQMVAHGFKIFKYHPFERRLEPIRNDQKESRNVIYVKNLEAVTARIVDAPHYQVHGHKF